MRAAHDGRRRLVFVLRINHFRAWQNPLHFRDSPALLNSPTPPGIHAKGFLWSGGKQTDIGALPPGPNGAQTAAIAINQRGETLPQTIACTKYLGLRWFRSGIEGKVSLSDFIELHKLHLQCLGAG